eukprot:6254714-Alexandrium_andersonii.AAC.1
MSASLVGSEMCIRDSARGLRPLGWRGGNAVAAQPAIGIAGVAAGSAMPTALRTCPLGSCRRPSSGRAAASTLRSSR